MNLPLLLNFLATPFVEGTVMLMSTHLRHSIHLRKPVGND